MTTRIYAAEGIQQFFKRWDSTITNPSTIVNQAVERYNYLLTSNLPSFLVEEWGIIFDMLSERMPIPIQYVSTLGKMLIQDMYHNESLVAKWGIDSEALAEKLISLDSAQVISMLDAAERYITTNIFEGVGLPGKSSILQ